MTNTDAMSAPGRLVYITLPGVDLYVYRSRSTCFVVLDLDLIVILSLSRIVSSVAQCLWKVYSNKI